MEVTVKKPRHRVKREIRRGMTTRSDEMDVRAKPVKTSIEWIEWEWRAIQLAVTKSPHPSEAWSWERSDPCLRRSHRRWLAKPSHVARQSPEERRVCRLTRRAKPDQATKWPVVSRSLADRHSSRPGGAHVEERDMGGSHHDVAKEERVVWRMNTTSDDWATSWRCTEYTLLVTLQKLSAGGARRSLAGEVESCWGGRMWGILSGRKVFVLDKKRTFMPARESLENDHFPYDLK